MPWYEALGIGRRTPAPAPEKPASVTAAAAPVRRPESQFLQRTQAWQEEAWGFYDTCGEANYGVAWLANMMSQVRLRAGKLIPGADEPEILDNGLAAEIVATMAGGVGGQSHLMRSLATQLQIPGDSYLVGEEVGEEGGGTEVWTVRSVEEVRVQNGRYQTVADRIPSIEWRDLPAGSVPVRIWRPHARYHSLADSPMRSALPILRELELVNRHITAQYLSRLASAGVVIFPDEVTFPVREEFEDADDPFVAEWIEVAAEAIRTPGTAAAVVPIPIRVPAEYVDKVKFLDFTLQLDEKIIEKRDAAINRLATKLDIPTEVLTGMGKVNHWTAWQLDEGALKTHIAPLVEIICYSLTTGYLQPRLKASGQDDWASYVYWYDLSELAIRPDNSANAKDAYDRLEISGEAYRRENGFDESDKPSMDELAELGLKAILRNTPGSAPSALDALVGRKVMEPAEPTGPVPVDTTSPAPTGTEDTPPAKPGPPDTKDTKPANPKEAQAAAAMKRGLLQAQAMHAVMLSAVRPAELLHPPLCQESAYSCPYTHAAWGMKIPSMSSGVYECRLDSFGRITVGQPNPRLDTSAWVSTTVFRSGKGRAYARA